MQRSNEPHPTEEQGSSTAKRNGATDRVTLVEAGGSGGVFQHSLAVGIALAEDGVAVRIITAKDAEIDDGRIQLSRVLDWHRKSRFLRGPRILASFVFHFVPTALRAKGVVWVQGSFKPGLTLWLLLLLRIKGASLLYSPHTLFSRHGGAIESLLFNLCIRIGGKIVVYNESDFAELLLRGKSPTLAPLAMYVPPLRAEVVLKWQEYVATNQITVCSVGQLRVDKNLPLLVRSCAAAGRRVLIAGQDAGALADISREGALHPDVAHVIEAYLEMDDLAAILYVVGVAALPYSVASQSAVAVLARAYGCTTIAYEVGGLGSQADITVPTLDSRDWVTALREVGDRTRLSGEQGDLPSADPELARTLRKVVGIG